MSSWWPPSEALSQKLESLLSLGEDLSYFPSDAYEERRGRFLLRVVALLILAAAAHVPGLTDPWLWTDLALVPGNPLLHSVGGLAQFWVHPVTNGQAPLAQSVLYLEFLAFNNSTLGYHLVTLLAHAGSCILLWFILRRLDVPGAWLAAAIFAVHPIEVQSVSWMSRQGDVLACVAGLGSLLIFLTFNEIHPPIPAQFTLEPQSSLLPRVTSVSLLLAALLCQPSCFMLAAVFAIILRWKRGTFQREEMLAATPFIAIGAVGAVLGFYFSLAMHFGGPAAVLTPVDRILVAGRAVCFYATSIVWPAPLLFIYPRWHLIDVGWMTLFPAAVLAAVAGLWWARRRFGNGPLVAGICFLCLLLPHVGLVRCEWLAYSFVADHLQYLAGIPLIILLAAALTRLAGLVRSEHWQAALRLGAGAAILGGLGTLSWFATLPYAGEERLWKSTLTSDPSSLIVRAILAQFYLKQGKLPEAAGQFPENIVSAMRLQASQHGAEAGGVAGPMLAWAHVLEAQRRYSDAAAFYQQVLAIDPRNHEAAIRLAWSYKERGDNAKAIRSFADAVAHYPADETLQNDFGLALADSGNFQQAIDHYQAAIGLNSNYVAARINLSKALFSLGKYPESSEQLKIASDLDPRSYDAFFTAGLMLATLKNYPASERMFRAAVQLRPDSAEASNDLGIVQAAQGFFNDAVDNFVRAVKLNPDFKEARDNLARARQERDAKQP